MPKPAVDRPLHLSAFVVNTPSHVIHGSWRAPEAANHEINSLKRWVDLARYLDQAAVQRHPPANVTCGVGAARFGRHVTMMALRARRDGRISSD